MSRNVLSLLLASALLAGVSGPVLAARAEPAKPAAGEHAAKTAVVDLRRCLEESKTGKKAKAEFEAKAQQVQAELDKKEASLKELREQLQKQGIVLSPAARAEKEKEYREKVDAFKEQVKATQQSFSRQDQEVPGRVMKELQAIVRKLAEAGGYSVVLEKAAVIYVSKEVDLTDEVIRRYDQEADQKGKTEERK